MNDGLTFVIVGVKLKQAEDCCIIIFQPSVFIFIDINTNIISNTLTMKVF